MRSLKSNSRRSSKQRICSTTAWILCKTITHVSVSPTSKCSPRCRMRSQASIEKFKSRVSQMLRRNRFSSSLWFFHRGCMLVQVSITFSQHSQIRSPPRSTRTKTGHSHQCPMIWWPNSNSSTTPRPRCRQRRKTCFDSKSLFWNAKWTNLKRKHWSRMRLWKGQNTR